MADPQQCREWLRLPLYQAASKPNPVIVSSLLSATGADVTSGFRDHRGSSLLHAAASGGSVEILDAFIEAGCGMDVNTRQSQLPRRTPLHCAVRNGHRDAARALISVGGDPTATDANGQMPLHLACARGHTAIVSDLLKLGSLDTETQDVDGNTPLALAVTHGRLDALKLLLELGASVQTRSSKNRDALDIALKGNHVDCMRALLAFGANLEAVDQIGLTALLSATRLSNTAAIAALIEAGADVDGRGGTVWTPLHFAAHGGNVEAIEALVLRGGDLNARTSLKGSSPLHIAAGHAKTRAVQELLLRWGADETALDARGQTALDVAGQLKYVFDRGHKHEEQVELVRHMLANAPADKRWIRRRVVMVLVSREKTRMSRERDGREKSGVKKRGGEGGGHDVATVGCGAGNGGGTAEAGDQVAECAGGELTGRVLAFRDALVRLAGMDDEDIFRSVVSFL